MEEVMVKIRADKDHYYIQYGAGAQWEKIKKSSLPWSVSAILNTYLSEKFNLIIDAEYDTDA